MRVQHASIARAGGDPRLARRPLGIVTESAQDQPPEVIRAHGIHVVPLLLHVGLSSPLSGTFASAEAAAARFRSEQEGVPVHLFDSRAASILQGLLVLKAAEFGIVHVGVPQVVAEVREALQERYGPVEILDGPATAVLATHLGPGAWGVAYLVEDQE